MNGTEKIDSTVVLLHWLGGSGRTWAEVSGRLQARGVRVLAMDLPGFGDAAGVEGYGVGEMAGYVCGRIRGAGVEGAWVIGGHSMGGKVATVVARMACDGEAGLEGLRGVISVSGSPVSAEPMEETKREEMLEELGESTGDEGTDRERAKKFVTENVGKVELGAEVLERTVEDVLRMNRAAFRAWLTGGSKEDWAARVGVVPLPVLAMAGSEEPQLGPEAQREFVLPHFVRGEVVGLEGSGHLGPLERAGEVAELILGFMGGLGMRVERELGEEFRGLVESERVSGKTRRVMLARLAGGRGGYEPVVVSAEGMQTLRALAECVVPGAGFDLGARMDKRLAEVVASGKGDGFRHEAMPEAAEAWRRGLATLDADATREFGVRFHGLDEVRQLEMLRRAQEGELGRGLLGVLGLGHLFSAKEMQLWFADVRSELVRLFVADPRGMEGMGFTGFADEGGFTQIKLGEREEFEI